MYMYTTSQITKQNGLRYRSQELGETENRVN